MSSKFTGKVYEGEKSWKKWWKWHTHTHMHTHTHPQMYT